MELRMNDYQLPEAISFNFEELKAELESKAAVYASLVYTDENIKEAKADRASLNKLKKALNDERIRREKEYMVPFNQFKAQVNEIISIIDRPCAIIDKQVKEHEEKQKLIKLEQIKTLFMKFNFAGFGFEQIYEDKWLNASVSLKSIEEAMLEKINRISNDIKTLENLSESALKRLRYINLPLISIKPSVKRRECHR